MSNIPVELKYAKTHEWARINDDGSVTVGISDSAQDQLGDMVYIEVPELGQTVTAEEACAVIESVKAASDIYAPVSGKVIAINEDLDEDPAVINTEPYDGGWLFQLELSDKDELDGLKSAEDYAASLEG